MKIRKHAATAPRDQRVKAITGAPRPFLIEPRAIAANYSAMECDDEEHTGVAVINIAGVLSDDAWYGDTSYVQIWHELDEARRDPAIRGIVLHVDSPGGETDGAYETADLIAAVAKEKPVIAIANSRAYSAGYMLACQASQLVVQPVSGGVGSIGIYTAHFDESGWLEKIGIKPTLISAGEGKTDGTPLEPLSERALKTIQADIDRLYGAFVERVARARGMTDEGVRALGAFTFDGAARAIQSGLADASGSIDLALSLLATAIERKAQPVSTTFPVAINPAKAEINGGSMQEQNTAPTTAPPVPAPTGPTFADAEQIVTLCTLAGKPERASGFLAAKQSAAQVSAALLAERAEVSEAGGETVTTPTKPQPGAEEKFSFATFVRQNFATKGGNQ